MMTPYNAESTVTAELAEPDPSNPNAQHETTYEFDTSVIPHDLDKESLRNSIVSSLEGLSGDIQHRVKVELVAQIYTILSGEDSGAERVIDLDKITRSIREEYKKQSNTNAFMAHRLTTVVMPDAQKHPNRIVEADFDRIKGFDRRSVHDLESLGIRAETHHFLQEYAANRAQQTDDELREEVSKYAIEQVQAAKDEVHGIIAEQNRALKREKEQLEQREIAASRRILQLEHTVETLQEQLEGRDFEIWEGDMQEEPIAPHTIPVDFR